MTPNPIARLAFALLVALPVYAQAQTDELPPLPERNPLRVSAPVAEEPVLPGDAPTVMWTDTEVAEAKSNCIEALEGVTLDYEPLPPIKEGICGAPAPILVKSVGSDPKVEIDPPATVTCAVAGALNAWLSKTVQPRAKALIGSPVVKLHNATSYACRNRYGSAKAPLSEHALANALDISEFVFQSGMRVTVLDSWPRVAAKLPLPNPTRVPAGTGSISQVSHIRPAGTEAIEVTKVGVTKVKANPFEVPAALPEAKPPEAAAPTSQGVVVKNVHNPFVASPPDPETTPVDAKPAEAMPSGAMPSDETSPPQSLSEPKGEFVKTVHDDACHTFGTTLGPEANDAHKNHFHLDMKARRRAGFCE
jgi:hypothetical protein